MSDIQTVVEEGLNFTHAMTAVFGGGVVSTVGAVIYKFTKKDLRDGLLTKDDVLELLQESINDIQELKDANEKRIRNEKDLYEKTNDLGQRTSKLEGKLGE